MKPPRKDPERPMNPRRLVRPPIAPAPSAMNPRTMTLSSKNGRRRTPRPPRNVMTRETRIVRTSPWSGFRILSMPPGAPNVVTIKLTARLSRSENQFEDPTLIARVGNEMKTAAIAGTRAVSFLEARGDRNPPVVLPPGRPSVPPFDLREGDRNSFRRPECRPCPPDPRPARVSLRRLHGPLQARLSPRVGSCRAEARPRRHAGVRCDPPIQWTCGRDVPAVP